MTVEMIRRRSRHGRLLSILVVTGLLLSLPAHAATITDFMDQAYFDLLHRHIDSGAAAFFGPLLESHTISRTQFAAGVDTSSEYYQDLVSGYYSEFLRRTADGGRIFWANELINGYMTDEQVIAQFVGSDEYFNNVAGGTTASFMDHVFLDLLHRHIDPGAAAFWGNMFEDHSITRIEFVAAVDTSSEYYQDLVSGYYLQFLRHNADPLGRNAFASLLSSGTTDEQVIAQFVGSDEYFNNLPYPAPVPEPSAILLLLPTMAAACAFHWARTRRI